MFDRRSIIKLTSLLLIPFGPGGGKTLAIQTTNHKGLPVLGEEVDLYKLFDGIQWKTVFGTITFEDRQLAVWLPEHLTVGFAYWGEIVAKQRQYENGQVITWFDKTPGSFCTGPTRIKFKNKQVG